MAAAVRALAQRVAPLTRGVAATATPLRYVPSAASSRALLSTVPQLRHDHEHAEAGRLGTLRSRLSSGGPDLAAFLAESKTAPKGKKRAEGATAGAAAAAAAGGDAEDGSVEGESEGEGGDKPIVHPYIPAEDESGNARKVYLETYGCQMNVSDTEIAWSILQKAGFARTSTLESADVVLAVTCAIRDNAEQKVWQRLDVFKRVKEQKRKANQGDLRIGVLGCMAERLKTKLLETDKQVDIVAGPDSYRDLPRMLSEVSDQQHQVNVLLSMDETYADVSPVRLDPTRPSAFVSIQRGCDNMCAFCIVPFTRGRERSRPISSIVDEVRALKEQGVKEIVLLGQNVNSYRDTSGIPKEELKESKPTVNSEGFSTVYKSKLGGKRFAELLNQVAAVDREIRVRFTSPHPKDFPDEVLQAIKDNVNICRQLHIPIQSGSNAMLERMRRGHTREAYFELIDRIRSILPEVTISSDFIAGFCGETDADHKLTVDVMERVKYDMAYMFAYSMREKTHAYHKYQDDVPQETKIDRLNELIATFHREAALKNAKRIGERHLVLVDGNSKRSDEKLVGRTDGNIKVIFPRVALPDDSGGVSVPSRGDYVEVEVLSSTSSTLQGTGIQKTTLQQYYAAHPRQ